MAKLTAKARKGLKTSSFALPGKKKYPIEDASHARNALSRAAHNASPAEQSKIKRAVKKKFPSIAVDGKHDPHQAIGHYPGEMKKSRK